MACRSLLHISTWISLAPSNPETKLLFEPESEVYSASAAEVLAAIRSLDVEMWRMGCAPELRDRENPTGAIDLHPVTEKDPNPPEYDSDAKAPLRHYTNADAVVDWLRGFVLGEQLEARLVWGFD
jgi:hypothetical protein